MKTSTHVVTIFVLGMLLCTGTKAQLAPLSTTPNWDRATPNGPDTIIKITEEYARLVARDAYCWMWPMVNVYNRRLHFATITRAERSGPLMSAPLNQIAMLTDYVAPEERAVACPNQDVVYGVGVLALDLSPVVVQLLLGDFH